MKKVIENFSSFIGAGDGLTVKDYGYIVGVDFENKTKLKAKIEEILEKPSDGGSAGGGGCFTSKYNDGTQNALPGKVTSEQSEKLEVGIFADIKGVKWAKNSIVALAEKWVIGIRIYEEMRVLENADLPEKFEGEASVIDYWIHNQTATIPISGAIPTTYSGNGICGMAFGEQAKYLPDNAFENGLIL